MNIQNIRRNLLKNVKITLSAMRSPSSQPTFSGELLAEKEGPICVCRFPEDSCRSSYGGRKDDLFLTIFTPVFDFLVQTFFKELKNNNFCQMLLPIAKTTVKSRLASSKFRCRLFLRCLAKLHIQI